MLHPTVVRSLRRARSRRRVLLALSDLAEAYLSHLAAAAGLRAAQAAGVLHGALPAYKPELALVTLGLVACREAAFGTTYRLTASGREAVAALRAAPEPSADERLLASS